MQQLRLLSKGPDETFKIGQRLGSLLKDGDVVALFGELGSGKTTLVKGIASAFLIPERDITSASFTIIAEHKGSIPFYHIDLYRLEGQDLNLIGIEEFIGRGICVIEWAERLGEIPENYIKVRFNIIDAEKRQIIIEGINEENWDNR